MQHKLTADENLFLKVCANEEMSLWVNINLLLVSC